MKNSIKSVIALFLCAAMSQNVLAQSVEEAPIAPPSASNEPAQIGPRAFLWRMKLEPNAKYQARYFIRLNYKQEYN